MEANRHFTLIVAGDNADERLKEFDIKKKCERRLVLKFSDSNELHRKAISYLENCLSSKELEDRYKESTKKLLEFYQSMDDIDYFMYLADDEGLEIDEETGDGYTTANPNGKYNVCRIGKELSIPFTLINGEKAFVSKKKDIDWNITNANPERKKLFETVWDLVMGDKKPSNDNEKEVYENMKNRIAYFNKFGNKENYVASNVAFWGTAFLSEDNQWYEIPDEMDQFEWIRNFYSKFIANLQDNTTLSVYECVRY